VDDQLFPKPAIVRKQVRFWEKVFHKYPSTTVIVHEAGDLDRIIDLIDYKVFKDKDEAGNFKPVPRKERDEVTLKYLKRYNKAVERFAKEGEGAVRYGAIEKRLYNVYRKSPLALRKLLTGELKIRAQTGLADDFRNAAATARGYLPYMERVFHQYGLPTKLTRLPFVESMFNLKARSKVGASGIWQFMPATARHYIYVTSLVDERNNPYKATKAAAQFLTGNYRDLKHWPLAITAYNHGKVGMERAVKQVGSADIGKIIQKYDSPSFGFASRNFYAEFLAAVNVFEKLEREGKVTDAKDLPATTPLILQEPASVADLIKHTPLTKEILAEHNPCLLESTLATNANKALPSYYEIRVPTPLAPSIKAAMQTMNQLRYARR
jgi:membrane-bound lytic murein transglycosylase D